MSFRFGRREFLKLASLLPLAAAGTRLNIKPRTSPDPENPNVLVIVFDALSALNVSLYGYPRETMPNLERFAQRATVFHSHYSAGNFTTPGTASMFTGVYPWTHRALSLHATVSDSYQERNLFHEFRGSSYTRMAFSHNIMVNILLHHFRDDLDDFVLPDGIVLADYNLSDNLFFPDYNIAYQAEQRSLKKPRMLSNSLYLSPITWALKTLHTRSLESSVGTNYHRGLPGTQDILYPLGDTINWIMDYVQSMPQPFIAYMHMMPPHDPYNPSNEFVAMFYDGWQPLEKPTHFFKEGHSQDKLNLERIYYDQFVAYVDAEFGRLYDFLEVEGILDHSYVVFTTDHGEMFERGIWKHITPTLYEPIIRVPLLISSPGQDQRHDVYASTSAVDLLPTLLHVTGRPVPEWSEGVILPPYTDDEPDGDRSIFVVEGKSNPKTAPMIKATMAMIKGPYKLIYYKGYEDFDDIYELYDLANDPDEMDDLIDVEKSLAADLKNELLREIEAADEPFNRT